MTPTSPVRSKIWYLALAPALLALAFVLARAGGTLALPLHDFVEYWAAGRLLLDGQNPYDPDLVHELESQAGRTDEGILMWNPPWSLPLVLPLGLLDVRTAHILWLLLNLGIVAFSAVALWQTYAGATSHRGVALLLACTFVPTYIALIAGQISPFLLLGAVLFLTFVKRGDDFLAGVAASLLGIKPHLAYLFWFAILFWAIRERRWRVLAGGVFAGLALTGMAMAFRPTVVADYWHTLTTQPPQQYRSPTLGTLIRMTTVADSRAPGGAFRWQFLPMLAGLTWLAWYQWRHRRDWTWGERLPLLLLVSMLTTPYGGWPFDLVLLLVPVVYVAVKLPARLYPAALFAHASINALALTMLLCGVEYLGFIWMTPALLIAYALLRHAPVHEPTPSPRAA